MIYTLMIIFVKAYFQMYILQETQKYPKFVLPQAV